MTLSIIVAADENNVIGHGNSLIWKLPDDLKHFRKVTEGHTVIMGRKTFDSIGRPLPNRRNIVITRQKDLQISGCEVVQSLSAALDLVASEKEALIIGGSEIYLQTLEKADRIYLTRVHGEFIGDSFFPGLDPSVWKEVSTREHPEDEQHSHAFTFFVYERRV